MRPVCLPPRRSEVTEGALCSVVGWGQLFESGRIFREWLPYSGVVTKTEITSCRLVGILWWELDVAFSWIGLNKWASFCEPKCPISCNVKVTLTAAVIQHSYTLHKSRFIVY